MKIAEPSASPFSKVALLVPHSPASRRGRPLVGLGGGCGSTLCSSGLRWRTRRSRTRSTTAEARRTFAGLALGSEVVPDATVEAALPFSLLSFDRDNGGEFLNCHLWHPELRARQTEIDPLALVKDKQRRLREIFAMARRVIPASETH